ARRGGHGGPGQLIDNAASESILRLVGEWTVPAAGLGLPAREKSASTEPSRIGPGGDFRALGVFLTQDGRWCTFTPSTRPIWERFMKALGHEDFLNEGDFVRDSAEWKARSHAILMALRGW